MKFILTLFPLLLTCNMLFAQDCTLARYQAMLKEADQAVKKGEYDLAINKLQSAKTCRPEKEAEVDKKIVVVFEKVNGERKEAQRQKIKAEKKSREAKSAALAAEARQIYNTDNTLALRLAEAAFQIDKNEDTRSAFHDIISNIESAYYKTAIQNSSPILSIAYSPDGKLILTGCADSTATLWDNDGNILQIFKGHDGKVVSVAFSSSGKLILTGSYDGTAKIWSIDGKVINTLEVNEGEVFSVAFSHLDNTILTGSYTVKMWDANGNILHEYGQKSEYNGLIASVAFSSDGLKILATADQGDVKIFNKNGQLFNSFKSPEYISAAAFSPNGKMILTAGDMTRLWNLDGNLLRTFESHKYITRSVAFSPDGSKIITAGDDGIAKIWSLDGKKVAVLRGHKEGSTFAVFSPNGQYVLTGSYDMSAKLWDFSIKPTTLISIPGHYITSAVFSPDDQFILVGTGIFNNYSAKAWIYSKKGNPIASFSPYDLNKFVLSVAFSPDGNSVVAGGDRFSNLWNSWKDKGHLSSEESTLIPAGNVRSVTFSPDGAKVLTGGASASLWTLDSRQIVNFESSSCAALSPDGLKILTCSSDTATMWSLEGKKIKYLTGHKDLISSLAFSPDGSKILTGSYDSTAILWDFNGSVISKFVGHQERIGAVAFSPDGSKVATASRDNTIKIWLATGDLLATLPGQSESLVAFSHDGANIITASTWSGRDGEVNIWPSIDGILLATARLTPIQIKAHGIDEYLPDYK